MAVDPTKDYYADYQECREVFPAHAGMNRWCSTNGVWLDGVPRTRGDEPKIK